MMTTFIDEESRTICDLSEEPLPDGTPSYSVNRINTPTAFRGQGLASRLMRTKVLPAADAEGATLHLWIQPTGPMDYQQLASWYYRLNFRERTFERDGTTIKLWVRSPLVLV